jgi:hypothetical protein
MLASLLQDLATRCSSKASRDDAVVALRAE